MWRNYLTVGFRALAKNKTYAFINIFGLAIGMAACLMILLYVRYEFSYDRWLPDADRVYQIQSWYKSSETGQEAQLQMTPYRGGQVAARRISRRSSGRSMSATTIRSSSATARRRSTEDYLWVDGNFLDVVPLPMVRGDAQRARPGQFARCSPNPRRRRRFGTDDVVGQTLTLISRGQHARFPDHRHPQGSAAATRHLADQQPDPDRFRRL